MSILGLSSFTAADDRRQAYQANQQRAAVNAAREFNATFGNPEYVMSQPAEFYTNRDNLSKIKPTLVAMQGNKDFYTTDQNESRNMYQMLMNKMRGGQGAEMIDTRGLPAGAYRTGRTLFQDPAKSAGFRADLRNMLGDLTFQNKRLSPENRTSNPAAIRVNTYNPFPKAGFGKEFYKKEFPIASAFSNAMGKIENLPTLQLIKSFLPQRNRPVLERDPDFVKTDEELAEMGAYESLPMLEFNDIDPDMSNLDILDIYRQNSEIPPQFNIEKLRNEGKGGAFNLEDNIPSVVEPDEEIVPKIKPEPDLNINVLEEEDFNYDEQEISFNNQYDFVNDNPSFDGPFEYVMQIVDETGASIEDVVGNAILNGIIKAR